MKCCELDGQMNLVPSGVVVISDDVEVSLESGSMTIQAASRLGSVHTMVMYMDTCKSSVVWNSCIKFFVGKTT